MLAVVSPGEKVLRTVRKHWFIIAAEAAGVFTLFAAPFALYALLSRSGAATLPELSGAAALFFASLWSLLAWSKLFGVWTDYYLDLWVVTDRRIISVDQLGFFRRTLSVFRLDRIQDVTVDVHGVIPTLLNFGDLHVQTAGMERKFIIRGIPNPQRVKDLIMRAHDEALGRSTAPFAAGV